MKHTEEEKIINTNEKCTEEEKVINPNVKHTEEEKIVNTNEKCTEEEKVINPNMKHTEEEKIVNEGKTEEKLRRNLKKVLQENTTRNQLKKKNLSEYCKITQILKSQIMQSSQI